MHDKAGQEAGSAPKGTVASLRAWILHKNARVGACPNSNRLELKHKTVSHTFALRQAEPAGDTTSAVHVTSSVPSAAGVKNKLSLDELHRQSYFESFSPTGLDRCASCLSFDMVIPNNAEADTPRLTFNG